MLKHFYLLLFCSFITIFGFAQEVSQTLRGQVSDATTHDLLPGATVILTSLQKGETTDSLGRYRFEDVSPGRYELEVSFLGYQAVVIPEVLVVSGKETVLDVTLQATAASLSAITVRASRTYPLGASPTVRVLSIDETLRFPATFYDPARLAAALPGVVTTNDQANHLSVRGNSPNGLGWRLEGLEIVNPNHTSNAGTFSDQSTLNGGGVNALSAQVLDNSRFHTGVLPIGFSNATAGVLDMYFRPGNNEKREYTAQAGVIGFDLSTEGPLSKQAGSSYLVNYRYSFTGFLSDLGVALGDEDIRFQDLSFHLVFPNKKGGKFSLFGLGGKSSNVFTGPENMEDWKIGKDAYRFIDYQSQLGIIGLTYQQAVGTKGHLRLAGALSGTNSERNAQLRDIQTGNETAQNSFLNNDKLNFQGIYQYQIFRKSTIESGFSATNHHAEIGQKLAKAAYDGWIFEPFLNWKQRWRKLYFQVGIQLSLSQEAGTSTASQQLVEPRAQLTWKNTKAGEFSVAYGLHNQLPSPGFYSEGNVVSPIRAHQVVAGWKKDIDKRTNIALQYYYQYLFDVPTSENDPMFSAVNFIEGIPDGRMLNDGKARSTGLEIQLQRFTGSGYSFLLSGTIYNAEYQNASLNWADSRYNGRFATNIIVGKEWTGLDKNKRPRLLGVNLSFRMAGNQRLQAVDLDASRVLGETVFDQTIGFEEALKNYFRSDFRIYYQKNGANWSSTLSFDVQNMTNSQNEAYHYFDAFLDQIETQYQLELLPILSYRINF